MMTVPNTEVLMSAANREGCNVSPPEEKVIDTIKFMINNISQINLAKKVNNYNQIFEVNSIFSQRK
jgi:hypothetical protein